MTALYVVEQLAEPLPGYHWRHWVARATDDPTDVVCHSHDPEVAQNYANDFNHAATQPLYVSSHNTGRLGRLLAIEPDRTGLGWEFGRLQYETSGGQHGAIRCEFAGIITAGGRSATEHEVRRYIARISA
jgi:hypothetical protein